MRANLGAPGLAGLVNEGPWNRVSPPRAAPLECQLREPAADLYSGAPRNTSGGYFNRLLTKVKAADDFPKGKSRSGVPLT